MSDSPDLVHDLVDPTTMGGVNIGDTIGGGATQGSVLFVGAAGVLAQDNTNFFWDDTTNQLKLGNGTAAAPALRFSGATSGIYATGASNVSMSTAGTQRFNLGTGACNFTVPIRGAAGTAASASFAKQGDIDTGLYFPADNTLAATAAGTERMRWDGSGNVVVGTAQLADNATDGFLYIPGTTGGTPTGTPTAYAGRHPLVVDDTNQHLYIYDGSAWFSVGAGGAFTADGDTLITPTTSILIDQATGNETAFTLDATVNKATSGVTTLIDLQLNETGSGLQGLTNVLVSLLQDADQVLQVAQGGSDGVWRWAFGRTVKSNRDLTFVSDFSNDDYFELFFNGSGTQSRMSISCAGASGDSEITLDQGGSPIWLIRNEGSVDNFQICQSSSANPKLSIEAGAPNNSFYMQGTGQINLGTATAAGTEQNLQLASSFTLTSSPADAYSASLRLNPAYDATSAQTVTRHNYIDLQDVDDSDADVTLTDACVFRFDAAAGTHAAVDAHSGAGTPTLGTGDAPVTGDPDAWMKVNLNGTIGYVPIWT
ncbi:hypothetical protein [Pararhizobium sp.]|uniref:hypothetical protein n=1 Tax=Pararhizobium sp. TaxID=1977563 RepID=UPI003D0EF52F